MVEIGTTFPHFYEGRWVNAEVASRRKGGLWTILLTEGGQVLCRGWECRTAGVREHLDGFLQEQRFPGRGGVVQWVNFAWPGALADRAGLWAEVSEYHRCGPYRPTSWARSDYANVEELLASENLVS